MYRGLNTTRPTYQVNLQAADNAARWLPLDDCLLFLLEGPARRLLVWDNRIERRMVDHDTDALRITKALELEELGLAKAREEIDEESRRAEEQVVRNYAARGIGQSRFFGREIADIHRGRAKRIVDKQVELRRATLQVAPEIASEEDFKKLFESAFATIDGVLSSIPERLSQRGQLPVDALTKEDESEAYPLKAHANREIEMLKREHVLQMIHKEKEARLVKSEAKDKRKVWVVHGRNLKARDAMFAFLQAIDLDPMEWGEALALTGKGTPYTGEVLDLAFAEAQAVVVLITGDDMARLGTRFAEPHDPPEETDPTPQARPNVLFEAGMAFGKYPERTVLVHFGKTRPFSDVAGRNILYISNDIKRRQGLVDRLRTAGCAVKIENRTQWHDAGDFGGATESADLDDRNNNADADLTAFNSIRDRLRASQANTHTPEIGSEADEQAQRLVKRGLLKPGPLGGYMVARLF